MAEDESDGGRPPLRAAADLPHGEDPGPELDELAEVMNRTFSPDSETGTAMRLAFSGRRRL